MPTGNLKDEKEQLLLVAGGDEKAFGQLFEQYTDALYGVALTYTKIPESAEEIVQDVFIKLWVKRATLASVDRFSDYLFILTRNHILNFLKKSTRERKYREQLTQHFQESALTPEQQILYKESEALIAKAAASLPPQQQMAFDLRRNQGFSLDEIADRMQISRNTVRNHLHRGLQNIRDFLQSNADGTILLICLLQLALAV